MNYKYHVEAYVEGDKYSTLCSSTGNDASKVLEGLANVLSYTALPHLKLFTRMVDSDGNVLILSFPKGG